MQNIIQKLQHQVYTQKNITQKLQQQIVTLQKQNKAYKNVHNLFQLGELAQKIMRLLTKQF